MNLETSIKDVITQKLEDGLIEKVIAEQLEKGVENALKDLLGSFGDVTKVIEKQVKSVMIPYLESYDYSEYITKLDSVLVDVLKSSALENKNLVENFKDLMIPCEAAKTIKATELFEHWKEYVANNVETDGLEIDYDDEPTYENVEVHFEVEHNEERSWSAFKHALLVFECDHDQSMNFAVKIHRWEKFDKEEWTIDYESVHGIKSLRHLNKFEVLMMRLTQNYTKVILDSDWEDDSVEPEERPEPSFY